PQHPLSETAPLAVGVADMRTTRSATVLLEAWRQVCAARRDARLWLLGDGQAREALHHWLQAQAADGNAWLPGVLEDCSDLLAAADLFVAPGAGDEAPLSLLRAMASALPIVAVDAPGHRLAVAHEQEALLVPADDTAAYAASMLRLLSDRTLAQTLGAAARRRAEERFSVERAVAQYEAIFEPLMHRAAAGRR
ncbi:MAG: glycosyltransferase, partial [Planctomycetales bacterium]|nr:glycosyltransferase [Planctomycetales bacterium]